MNLIEQLKRHEGFRSDYYQCTANKKTIGYGRNVDNNPFTADELKMLGREDFYLEPMTEEEAEFLLVNDVKAVHAQIYDKTGLARLNLARQAVCINMAFNLGVNGFLKFKNMLKAVKEERFERAAIEALDSRWASQVGDRADELANQLATGEWQ